MPSGIIMQSGSTRLTETDEARQEAISNVLEANGYEVEKPEPTTTEIEEPKREDFKTDEDFDKAQEEFEAAAEEAEEKAEAEREKKEQEKQERQESRHKLSRRQRAVDKATADLKKQLDDANKRILALEGGRKSEAPKVEVPKEPKREDFKSDKEFEDASFDYKYKLRRAKEAAEESRSALEEHLKENIRNYTEAKDQIKKEFDDWDEVLKEFGDRPVSVAVYNTILSLEEGPRVSYYLAKHPDILDQLNASYPDVAQREVTRLHDRLKSRKSDADEKEKHEAKPKPKPKVVLPAPVKPVSTAATNSTLSSRDAAQNRDFKAFKAAQRAGR